MATIRIPRREPSDEGGRERRILTPSGIGEQALGVQGDNIARLGAGFAAKAEHERREADALTYIRESAQLDAYLKAEGDNVQRELDDFALSPDWNEAAHVELFRQRQDALFEGAAGIVTGDRLTAFVEGQRAGAGAAGTTAEIERQKDRRAGLALGTTEDWVATYADELDLDFLPAVAQSANDKLAALEAERPELASEIGTVRAHSLRAIKNRYLRDEARGEIRFYGDLGAGAFDSLSPSAAAEERARGAARMVELVEEVRDQELTNDSYGEQVDNGGLFQSYAPEANVDELEALKENFSWLNEDDQRQLEATIDQAVGIRARRSRIMAEEIEPHFEHGIPLGPLEHDSERRAAYEFFVKDQLIPWLEQRPAGPEAARQHIVDRTAMLVREIQDVGYLSPALGAWVNAQAKNANAAPDTMMAVSMALFGSGFNEVLAQKVRTSMPELRAELAGELDIIRGPALDQDSTLIYSTMVRLSEFDAGFALKQAQNRVALRAKLGKGRGPSGAEARADPADRFFGGEGVTLTDAEKSAAETAEKVSEGILEKIQGRGVELQALPANIEGDVRALMEGFYFENLEAGFTDAAALESAADLAVTAFLSGNPPVTIGERVYLDRDIYDALEPDESGSLRWPPRMAYLEMQAFMAANDLDVVNTDIAKRGILVRPPGDRLEPGEFRVAIEGTDKEEWKILPGVLVLKGDESVYKKVIDETRLLGASTVAVPGDTDRIHAKNDELIDALFMDRDDYQRWASGYGATAKLEDQLGAGFASVLDFFGAVDLPEGARFESGVPPLTHTVTDGFIATGGEGLWRRSETLKRTYDAHYISALTKIESDRARGEDRLLVSGTFDPGGVTNFAQRELFAARDAEAKVREALVQEFAGKGPGDIAEFHRTGVLPSEKGKPKKPPPPLQPTRGPVP